MRQFLHQSKQPVRLLPQLLLCNYMLFLHHLCKLLLLPPHCSHLLRLILAMFLFDFLRTLLNKFLKLFLHCLQLVRLHQQHTIHPKHVLMRQCPHQSKQLEILLLRILLCNYMLFLHHLCKLLLC